MKLWLHSTRIGAATNSSSSHSILIFKPGAPLPSDTDDLADQERRAGSIFRPEPAS